MSMKVMMRRVIKDDDDGGDGDSEVDGYGQRRTNRYSNCLFRLGVNVMGCV